MKADEFVNRHLDEIAMLAVTKYFDGDETDETVIDDEPFTVGDVTIRFVTEDKAGRIIFYSLDISGDGFPKYEGDIEVMYRMACMRYMHDHGLVNRGFNVGHIIFNYLGTTDGHVDCGIAKKIF